MKTIEIRAAGTPSVSGIVKKAEAWIASKRVTVAVISAGYAKKIWIFHAETLYLQCQMKQPRRLPESLGQRLGTYSGIFLCPLIHSIGCHIHGLFALWSIRLFRLATGYDSRFSVFTPNETAMKTIEIRAAGTPSVSGIVKKAEAWIASKRVTVAAISATVCYAGTATGSDPLMFAGAFAALLAVRNLSGSATEKGGEK